MPQNYVPKGLESLEGKIVKFNEKVTLKFDKLIGKGSYAVVYKCVLPELAIKCIDTTLLTPSQLLRQRREGAFIRELRASSERDKEIIINLIHESESDDGLLCLFLEYCSLSLFSYIVESKEELPVALASRIFTDIMRGVNFIHRNGIYHRDLKPENLLLIKGDGQQLHVRVCDFGLATKTLLCNDFGCGSVRYISPECLNPDGKHACYNAQKNDIWSCAVVLINILSKKNPWHSASPYEQHYSYHFQPSNNIIKRDTFHRVFGYSDGLCSVLRKVFTSEAERIDGKAFLQEFSWLQGKLSDPDFIEIVK